MKTLYALLTGINRYHPESKGVSNLKGCENDLSNWKSMLEKQYGDQYNLNIKTLLNEQATYQNLVSHLGQEHLLRAGKEDFVLFFYSGHGSRQKSAPVFKDYFADEWDETIVCHDSRTIGGKDLADKEIAVLLSQISKRTSNIVVALDCCHAGSGLRSLQLAAKKQTPDSETPRPYEDYLYGWYAREFPGGKNLTIPNSRRLLLAACEKQESAFELPDQQGNFSKHLLEAIDKSGGKASYADLFARCRRGMWSVASNQNPQLETMGYFNAHETFLLPGGKANRSFFAVFNSVKKAWEVNCGAVQGIPVEPDRKVEFELYQGETLMGHAKACHIGMESSIVSLEFEATNDQTFQATLISPPSVRMPIRIVTGGGETLVSKALGFANDFHPIFFELSREPVQSTYALQVEDERLSILRLRDGKTLRVIEGNMEESLWKDAFHFLEHIARWEKFWALDNRLSIFKRSEVSIILTESKTRLAHDKKDVTLKIEQENSRMEKKDFILSVNNSSQQELHFAMYYFSPDFGIFTVNNQALPARARQIFHEDHFSLEANENNAVERIKLLVSTRRLDDFQLEMSRLKLGETIQFFTNRGSRSDAPTLMRGIGQFSKTDPADEEDWFALGMTVNLEKQG